MILSLVGLIDVRENSIIESKIQRNIVAKLESLGYLVRKMDSSTSVGWPDLIAISPEGVVYFLEVKTATGRLSKLQERTINQLRKNHGNVAVVRSVEEVLTFINQGPS